MAAVTFEGVGKVYPDGTRAVLGFDLEVGDGEFVVFVGPSGCGKTTALRMVAGLEDITEGTIRIGEAVINDVLPQKRNIAMVFQNYALYPHLNVAENIGFGLRMRKVPKDEIRVRVHEIARVLRLTELLERKPRVLSGGQRQRVAMGRAIVRDAKLRVQMRAEIARIQREIDATTIYVTHDQVEAMTMGDRVIVMRKGEIQQVDVPQAIYERPANLFVATFIGSPPMNLLRARLERENGQLVCVVGAQRLAVPPATVAARAGLEARVGDTIGVGVRPEHVQDATVATGAPAGRRLRGQAVATELLGSDMLVHIEIEAEPVLTAEVIEVAADIDATTAEELREEAEKSRTTIVCRFDAHSRIRVDDSVEIVLTTERMHFFDLSSGASIAAAAEYPRDAAPRVPA
jgi:multiple sugar transport system ATP-binding protein